MNRVETIWDPRYHTEASGHILSTRKQKGVVDLAQRRGLINIVAPDFDADAAWADIATVHNPIYVQAVRTGFPRGLAESQGFDWSPEFADALARIWQGHQFACRHALVHRLVMHPVSGAHHARRDRGAGFCTFNFLVGAGRKLLDDGLVSRVAVVDLDAHAGDGTLALVHADERFGLFDISGSGIYGGHYYVAKTVGQYFRALVNLPAFLDEFQPGLVMFQAGQDCFEGDYMGAVKGLSARKLAERDVFVLCNLWQRQIPTVVNLAGGYLETGETEWLHCQTIGIMADILRGVLTGKVELHG